MQIRKTLPVLGALLALALSPAAAGEVFGKIFEGNAAVGETASVAIQCGDTAYPAIRTDASGSYHVAVKETGKCTMTVGAKGQSASLAVASYDEAVQVDLVLEIKDGKLTVRRK